MNLLRVREDAEECVNDTWHAAWNRMPPDRPFLFVITGEDGIPLFAGGANEL